MAQPEENHPYAEELVQQALDRKLHETRQWLRLGHYVPRWFGGYKSEADGLALFNAPEGKTDPRAELIATLRSFFKDPAALKPEEEHPQCNFPARFYWMKKELGIDLNQLPQAECNRLDKWLEQLDPKQVTLVFSSFFMNNPASMFGHTLLRIDTQGKTRQMKLSNYGVNYGAEVDSSNPIVYAISGLFGFFKGTFSVFPYYLKVQEYSNWESRDLWEYELNLTPDQMQMLMFHLWELGGTYFDYFFFQENCSYHVLSVLEVANPEWHLTDGFIFSVQPADTLKIVVAQEGLVSKVVYRPAILSRMQIKMDQMTGEEKSVLSDLISSQERLKEEPYQKLEVPQKALVLDAYLDYLEYKGLRRKLDLDKPLRIPHAVLLERSKLRYTRDDRADNQPSNIERPDLAHGTDRLRAGIGLNDHELFQEIAYRPTLHDILGREVGLKKDSHFLFLDMAGRYYYESKKFRADRLSILDIMSLSPFESVFHKPSWGLRLGLDTLRDLDCDYCNSFKGRANFGLAYKPAQTSPFIFYALAGIDAETSGHLEENHRAGGGVNGGVFIDFGVDWRMELAGEYKRFPLGHQSEFVRYDARLRYSPHKDVDLRIEYMRMEHFDQGLFSLNFYY